MKSRIRVIAGALSVLACLERAASACDVCAVYTATEQRESRIGPFLGIAEQFTHFGTLQRGGDEVDNPLDEKIDSSITQVIFGYAPIPDLSLQANLPVIHRSFRRVEEGAARTDDETGIGDLSFVAQYSLWTHVTEQSLVRFSILGGVKFPTGDSDRLAEERGEGHDEGIETHAELAARALAVAQSVRLHGGEHHEDEIESGVHGHDLALGSGSYDGILGARMFASYDRAFATASVQYALRTEGDFDYAYADDLTWSGGPGYFLWLEHNRSLGLQASLSGETKGKDEIDDTRLGDTALTALYVGPGLLFTWGSSLGADLVGELPVIQNNTALQIVADYRIRGGVSWRF